MARIRSLKPEIWMSPQVMNLSHGARLLFIGMITQADDEGRGTADPRRLKAAIFGGDDIDSASVRRWLDECSTNGLAVIYEAQGHGMLYELCSWKQHQRIDRPSKSAYPRPSANTRRTLDGHSTNTRRGLVEDSSGIGSLGSDGSDGSDRTERARGAHETTRQVEQSRPAAGEDPGAGENHQAMDRIQALYPKGANPPNWMMALRHARSLVDDGLAAWDELVGATERYARFVASSGTLANVAAHNFFDRRKGNYWQQGWDPPPTKAEQRQSADVETAKRWLEKSS